MSHRPTRTAIKVLEYFSRQETREEAPPWEGHVNKREVQAYLEGEMDSPPSGSTLSRIFVELESLGYLDRNTQFGLKHGRWYPTQKAQRLDHKNKDSQGIDLLHDLEELKAVAKKTLDKTGLVGGYRASWIQGLIDGITGLLMLNTDLITEEDLEKLQEHLEDLKDTEPNTEPEELTEDDIRNSPALPTYLAENPTGWECHFCSGYPTYYSLKNFLEHLEEAHDFIIEDIEELRLYET